MTAVLIPTASEAEWLAARREGITASEIAIVMGLSPYSSPYKLYHQKLGILPADGDNPALERGRVLEPYVAEKFAAAHPEFKVLGSGRELYAHPSRDWQLATPDRTLHDWHPHAAVPLPLPVAVLETKTDAGSDEWGEPGTDEIPVHYRCQVLWQMDVMGVDAAFVACLRIRDWQVRVYEIALDDDAWSDLKLMRQEARDFLDRIDCGRPPGVDWRPATIDALKALHPSVTDEERVLSPQLARRYHAAVRNYKHWEQRKKLYEAQIRERLGSARRASTADGTFARRDVFEQREHVRQAATVDKLVPVYPKKES